MAKSIAPAIKRNPNVAGAAAAELNGSNASRKAA